MALIGCEECGAEVSDKAKKCPKCGAKVPKKTSLFTWLALVFIVYMIYVSGQTTNISTKVTEEQAAVVESSNSQEEKNENKKLKEPAKSKVKAVSSPKPSWRVSSSQNEMTGSLEIYAHSPTTEPTKRMSFPYSNVRAWLGVGCNKDDEWVYVGFSDSPNITDDETKDGYNLIRTRVKWDNAIENVVLTQKWGAKFLHFQNSNSILQKIIESDSALLELQWHGQQSVFFKFDLKGSLKAIGDIRGECAGS